MKDLYAILGLTPGATPAEIKVAYRRLARTCHPDVSASPDANARFAEINEAYHVLSDAHQRWAYDHGLYAEQRTFYASRQSEVVAKQRHFDRLVDEWIAHSRQEEAARADAVLLVVPLFLSTFYVMASKPDFIEQSALLGRVVILSLALYGLVYLMKNLSAVLARYTYEVPKSFTSVFREEEPRDKAISRKAGLFFLVSGYIVSLGLGYVVSKLTPGRAISAGTLLGAFLYPPIAVLIIGGLRRLGKIFDHI